MIQWFYNRINLISAKDQHLCQCHQKVVLDQMAHPVVELFSFNGYHGVPASPGLHSRAEAPPNGFEAEDQLGTRASRQVVEKVGMIQIYC